MNKTCKSCKQKYKTETMEGMKEFFHFKKTKSGNYFLGNCKGCYNAKAREKYREGTYNYNKSNIDSSSEEKEEGQDIPPKSEPV